MAVCFHFSFPYRNLLTTKCCSFLTSLFFFFSFHELFMMTTNFYNDVVFLGPVCARHKYAQRFKENDFEVVRKDGLVFLREMAAEVKNFMDFKMSAVMVSHL